MKINTFPKVFVACAFAMFAAAALPVQAEAQSFSYNAYPNNGYRASVCVSGFCAGGYQYSPTNYGYQFATNGAQFGYQYGQPVRYSTYQPRNSYKPYIPHVIIQQRTPTYYQRPDPYAFRRDYNQAVSDFQRELRYYTNY